MLDEQIAKNFIGHEKELELFEQWFDDNQQDAPWILFFHDATGDPLQKGGVGKTWLLRKCAMLAEQKSSGTSIVMVDFFSVVDRDGVEIARRIVEHLQTAHPTWNPHTFHQALSEYYQALTKHTDLTDIQARLYQTLVQSMESLDQHLGEQQKQLLICFDTFELVEQHPTTAVLGISQTFPDRYRFQHIGAIITGRNAPDWQHPNWQGREHEVLCVPIEPFTEAEMVQFLNENCHALPQPLVVHSDYGRELHQRTQGRPILIGLVADVLDYRILTLDQLVATEGSNFEKYLVSQINRLDRPINWVVLFMAHIYHRFTPDLLEWLFTNSLDIQSLMQEINPRTLFEKLIHLSFVRRSGTNKNIALHDEMRRMVNAYNWPEQELETGLYRHDLSLGVISYYENENKKSTVSEKMRQTNIVELLYHKLYVDLNDGFQFFELHFKRAINLWQHAFARSLLQEAQKFEHLLSPEQHYTLLKEEAILLVREESYKEALALFHKIEELVHKDLKGQRTDEQRADLLFEQGRCYLQMSRFDEAIGCFSTSLEIETKRNNEMRSALILSQLGHLYRRQGELKQAAEYYERSIALYKKNGNRRGYADVLHSISILSRLQGKFEDSLMQCNVALRIRQELYSQGAGSEVAVAFSLGGIGTIYLKLGDLIQAQKYFQEAYEIYERSKYHRGIATIYNRFGQVAMEKNEQAVAMNWFQKAYQEALGIDADAEVNSLNKQGRVLFLQNHLGESIPYFEQAIQRASESHDFYQQAESLVDQATAYERLELYEPARQALQIVEEITAQYHYYYLLGQTENLRGDHWHKEMAYSQAFEHYGKYCYNMALYNQTEYERAVRKTMSVLLALPLPHLEVLNIQQQLSSYWHSLQLEEEASPMLRSLKEVRTLMDV